MSLFNVSIVVLLARGDNTFNPPLIELEDLTHLSKDLEVLNDREQLGLAGFHLTGDVLKQIEARPARKIFDNLRSKKTTLPT